MQDDEISPIVVPADATPQDQPQPEEDYGWATHWEDDAESVVQSVANSTSLLVDALPPQLHPAVSLGLQRVSSCAYFSLQSSSEQQQQADMYSLSSGLSEDQEAHADWLYHDVIMHVFTFLDAKSLAAFSETARRCNYECFYFLQLQLQRALLEDNLTTSLHYTTNTDRLASIAGSWTISRLASMDKQEAQDVVQDYLDSNETLRTMPLSHSLAYIRQVLRRSGFPAAGGGQQQQQQQQQQAQQRQSTHHHLTTSAALLVALVGAATVMSGNLDAEAVESIQSFGTELPNMLFKVGFVGSLMGAARHGWESQTKRRQQQQEEEDEQEDEQDHHHQQQHHNRMRETAEQMARMVQEMLQQVRMTAAPTQRQQQQQQQHQQQQDEEEKQPEEQDGFFSRRMYDAFLAASGVASDNREEQPQIDGPWSPNPYEHLPRQTDDSEGEEKVDDYNSTNTTANSNNHRMLGFRMPMVRATTAVAAANKNTKMPSGCVGAYFRAIQRASKAVREGVQKQRQERFEKLVNKEDVARSFIDACCSDDTIDIVKNLVQLRSVIDPSGFYVGSDGTETCALHASAFHGATQVLEFLCGGIDERDPRKDEGLVSVDTQDVNGWTALHFAAGANCVESARILADRGANLSVVAENGYTPLQWAQRLSNHEVAEELRMRLEQTDPYHQSSNHRWIAPSMIAHRFFAMIPTH